MDNTPPLPRRLLAELLGSAFLAAVVIGSGIAAQTLSPERRRSCSCSRTPRQRLQASRRSSSCSAPFQARTSTRSSRSPMRASAGIAWRDVARLRPCYRSCGCVLGAVTANAHVLRSRPSASPHTTGRRLPICSSEAIATAGPAPGDLLAGAHQTSARRLQLQSAPTSVRPTSSRARRASRTPRSPSGECSPIRSPASRRPPSRGSSSRSSSAASLRDPRHSDSLSGRDTRRGGRARACLTTTRRRQQPNSPQV